MPYIDQEDRPQYDKVVEMLQSELAGKPIGHINYVISRVIWKLFDQNSSYTFGSALKGVLHDIADEFGRRKLDKYEDIKIKENGDLPEGD